MNLTYFKHVYSHEQLKGVDEIFLAALIQMKPRF